METIILIYNERIRDNCMTHRNESIFDLKRSIHAVQGFGCFLQARSHNMHDTFPGSSIFEMGIALAANTLQLIISCKKADATM